MVATTSLDPVLTSRLAAAGSTAEAKTESAIQRVRGWCLVFALVQTAIYPGTFWYLAWGAMALLVLNWAWVRWALAPDSQGPPVHVVGIVAMAVDSLAVIMVMANLMSNPDDPVQLLPLALAVEAGVRWARPGGIVGGLFGGLLLNGWSAGAHARAGEDLVLGYAAFRFGVVLLIGGIVGNAVREQRQQRRAADAVFQASRDLMATFTASGVLIAANPACEVLLGYTTEELRDRPTSFLEDLGSGEGASVSMLAPVRVVRSLQHKDGHQVWVEIDVVPDPQSGLVYAIGRDISDRSRTESELRHRVDHDGLTGAWNRHALLAYLHRMLSRGYLPSLVFIDLDHFKVINDRHGHIAGDAAIRELARRLGEAAGHEGMVARYAGDEFCIVVDDAEDLELVTARARGAFDAPFDLNGTVRQISGSIGTASSQSGDAPEHLVHRADQAMYAAKKASRVAG